MGRKRTAQKDAKGGQSSLSSLEKQPSKVENLNGGNFDDKGPVPEPAQKKMEDSSNPPGESQVGTEAKEEAASLNPNLNDLPPEVLRKILQCEATSNLFFCRLVSRKFNQVSSGILRSRPEAKTEFEFSDNEFFNFVGPATKTALATRTLKDFLACFKESKNCPFAHFTLILDYPVEQAKFFYHEDWLSFLSQFEGAKIKCLTLNMFPPIDSTAFPVLAQKVGDLLLKQMPNLEEFGSDILSPSYYEADASQLRLFPDSSSSSAERKDRNSKSNSVTLPHLKVLYLGNSLLEGYPGICKDLSSAAVNLKTIHILFKAGTDWFTTSMTPSTYQALQSMGKFHCLEEARILLHSNFLDQIKEGAAQFSNPPDFKFKRLTLFVSEPIRGRESERENIARVISNILSSSRNTLKDLTVDPLGFSNYLQLPTFTNLKELCLVRDSEDHEGFPFFPPGIRSRNVFPAVSILDLRSMGDLDDGFPHDQPDSIPRFPSVKILEVSDSQIYAGDVLNIALMCKNLKDFKISRWEYADPPEVDFFLLVQAIWTDLSSLEYLEIAVDVDATGNTPFDWDSCFTGISEENCQRLQELREAVNTFKKWGVEVPNSDSNSNSNSTVDREYASILDMKDLRRLVINPYSGDQLLDRKCFFKDKLTWISQEYAFKLMPQLKITED